MIKIGNSELLLIAGECTACPRALKQTKTPRWAGRWGPGWSINRQVRLLAE